MSDWQYDWYVLGAIALLVLCSLLTRSGYFMFGDLLPLTERMRRALRFAPVAALAAIIIPELLPWAYGDTPRLDIKALASLVAVLVFIRTRNAVWVIVAGIKSIKPARMCTRSCALGSKADNLVMADTPSPEMCCPQAGNSDGSFAYDFAYSRSKRRPRTSCSLNKVKKKQAGSCYNP